MDKVLGVGRIFKRAMYSASSSIVGGFYQPKMDPVVVVRLPKIQLILSGTRSILI
ncbi:hypothetical protein KIN20_032081 [Parelaphostrongylus tenuis]|uniref:Uncharacterized protein n=1 Tax=Parelaphostrongylus tenuis TaxID=148309 RepID=A0AAD5WHG8_PARTN|nr:hypothetical protein KIN20_032081 [Parelaphostrongylus tenuis]